MFVGFVCLLCRRPMSTTVSWTFILHPTAHIWIHKLRWFARVKTGLPGKEVIHMPEPFPTMGGDDLWGPDVRPSGPRVVPPPATLALANPMTGANPIMGAMATIISTVFASQQEMIQNLMSRQGLICEVSLNFIYIYICVYIYTYI